MLYNLQPFKKISDFSKSMVLISFKVDFEHLFGLSKQLFIDRKLILMGTDVNRQLDCLNIERISSIFISEICWSLFYEITNQNHASAPRILHILLSLTIHYLSISMLTSFLLFWQSHQQHMQHSLCAVGAPTQTVCVGTSVLITQTILITQTMLFFDVRTNYHQLNAADSQSSGNFWKIHT